MTNKGKTIHFITGASGVGKTTLVNQLEEKYKSKPWMFLHFDHIGVPSIPEMIREFGSPTRWQEAKAHEWIDQLVNRYEGERIFFEGQVNLQFIHEAFEKHHFKYYRIILIDCSEHVMEKRLVHERKQPELFNADMIIWLIFLRNQAKKFEATVIDSSELSEKELLMIFEKAIKLS
jgi:broad-specificity NMP kinase